MSPGVRGGAGRRGAEAPIDQVQGQANRIRPGKGCAGGVGGTAVAAQGDGESGGRSGLLPVAARWCLLLHVATCCCALLKQVSWFVVLSMHSSPIDSL